MAKEHEFDYISYKPFLTRAEKNNAEIVDLTKEWLPRKIYGDVEYRKRILMLNQRRYYGKDSTDKAGILRYTKVNEAVFDINSIPAPLNEREVTWLLSFYWGVDQAYDSLDELGSHLDEGR